MKQWPAQLPPIDLALLATVGTATLVGLTTRPRGGRFRGAMGWVGFWIAFSVMLVALSRAPAPVGLGLLALTMFVTLRAYFSLAPVRPRDRYAILAAYLCVVFALYAGFTGSEATFLATVPIVLFLVLPVLLSIGPSQKGFLDSMGRILLGALIFVFCAAHLGLLVHWQSEGAPALRGLPELFGVVALACEIPQRVLGRYGDGITGWGRASFGLFCGVLFGGGAGYLFGPSCGLVEEDAARAGILVALAMGMGTLVTAAVLRDLGLGASECRVGRGALLDRAVPALYAAPVYFHYLNHFA